MLTKLVEFMTCYCYLEASVLYTCICTFQVGDGSLGIAITGPRPIFHIPGIRYVQWDKSMYTMFLKALIFFQVWR